MSKDSKSTHAPSAHSGPERHSGALFGCVDRRAGRHDMFFAKGWPKHLSGARFDFLGAYRYQTAANKIHLHDAIVGQVIELGLEHGGKHAFVIGHSGVCGGMNAQHELHQLEHQLRMARRNGLTEKVEKIARKIERLQENVIYKEVAEDLHSFAIFEAELRKIFVKDEEYSEFIATPDFRELAEEFNVLLQLSKLKNRPDFKKINAKKPESEKIVLIGGMYEPREKLSPYKKLVPVPGKIYFDFPKLYALLGENRVNHLLKALGFLNYKPGNGIFEYR